MKRVTLIACSIMMLLVGCTSVAPSRSSRIAPSAASTSGTVDATATPASIPSMEFVARSTFPKGSKVVPGAIFARNTYRPFLDGSHIKTARWVQGEVNGAKTTELWLTFDAAGTATLAKWTKAHIGREMAILVDGHVLVVPVVNDRIAGGNLSIHGLKLPGQRPLIDAAIVPTP